jgi:nicotinate-nucleotide pyrophosphorylase (carboxylating)
MNTLHDSRISRLIELALVEDLGLGDVTGDATVPEGQLSDAMLLCKQEGVAAGLDVAALVFRYCDHSITLTPAAQEGDHVSPGSVLARIHGDTRAILRGERTALNFLQRMSGIATLTRRYVEAVQGTGARITDTRKTAPGLRVLDKRAVRTGGGVNHRFGLDDMVLIKDNHIAAAGSVRAALERVRRFLGEHELHLRVEVETRSLEEVREALAAGGADRIMLDNLPVEEMRRAVDLIARRAEVEASGGVTLATVRAIAGTGVDFISVGALTHSVTALDIALDFLPAGHA